MARNVSPRIEEEIVKRNNGLKYGIGALFVAVAMNLTGTFAPRQPSSSDAAMTWPTAISRVDNADATTGSPDAGQVSSEGSVVAPGEGSAAFLDFLFVPEPVRAKFDAVGKSLDPATRVAVNANVGEALNAPVYRIFDKGLSQNYDAKNQFKNPQIIYAKNGALAAAAALGVLQEAALSDAQKQTGLDAIRQIILANCDTVDDVTEIKKARAVVSAVMDEVRASDAKLASEDAVPGGFQLLKKGMLRAWNAGALADTIAANATRHAKKAPRGKSEPSATVRVGPKEHVAGPIPKYIVTIDPVNPASGQTFPITPYDRNNVAKTIRDESEIISRKYGQKIGDEGKMRIAASIFCRRATGNHGATITAVLTEARQYDAVTEAGGLAGMAPAAQHDIDLVDAVINQHLTYGYATSYLNPKLTLKWGTYWGTPSLWVATVGEAKKLSHQFFRGQMDDSGVFAREEIVPKDFVIQVVEPPKPKHTHVHRKHEHQHQHQHHHHHRSGSDYAELKSAAGAVTAKRPLVLRAAAVFNPNLVIG
jgi:hypothetical protein